MGKMIRMLIKYPVLPGIFFAMAFLLIAMAQYPGGSQHDATAPGFDWQHNYLSNLFNPVAVNGQDNIARPCAVAGMLFLCLAGSLFFVRFSKKVPFKSAANIIKYAGIGAATTIFFAATPYHDTAIKVSSTLLLLSFFYITVFILKSRLHRLKVLSVVNLVVLYGCCYMYYSSTHLEWLPVVQKVSLLITLVWILALEFGTERGDFQTEISGQQAGA